MTDNTIKEQHQHCQCKEDYPLATRLSGEVVHGKKKMQNVKKAISIFGGAKAKYDSWEYLQTYNLAHELGKRSVSVISGGGPGVMEAANKGTKDAKNEIAKAIGLNIDIMAEINDRQYQDISIDFEHFASRKIIFCAHSDAFVIAPGGFGTLDELFEAITLMQTEKSPVVPIILMGRNFWEGMMNWVENVMHKEYGLVSQKHMELMEIADDWEDVIRKLETKKVI